MVVFGLGQNLLFKSILGLCVQPKKVNGNFVFSFNILVSLDDEFPFEASSGSTNDGQGVISHDDLVGKFAFLYDFQRCR